MNPRAFLRCLVFALGLSAALLALQLALMLQRYSKDLNELFWTWQYIYALIFTSCLCFASLGLNRSIGEKIVKTSTRFLRLIVALILLVLCVALLSPVAVSAQIARPTPFANCDCGNDIQSGSLIYGKDIGDEVILTPSQLDQIEQWNATDITMTTFYGETYGAANYYFVFHTSDGAAHRMDGWNSTQVGQVDLFPEATGKIAPPRAIHGCTVFRTSVNAVQSLIDDGIPVSNPYANVPRGTCIQATFNTPVPLTYCAP